MGILAEICKTSNYVEAIEIEIIAAGAETLETAEASEIVLRRKLVDFVIRTAGR